MKLEDRAWQGFMAGMLFITAIDRMDDGSYPQWAGWLVVAFSLLVLCWDPARLQARKGE